MPVRAWQTVRRSHPRPSPVAFPTNCHYPWWRHRSNLASAFRSPGGIPRLGDTEHPQNRNANVGTCQSVHEAISERKVASGYYESSEFQPLWHTIWKLLSEQFLHVPCWLGMGARHLRRRGAAAGLIQDFHHAQHRHSGGIDVATGDSCRDRTWPISCLRTPAN